MTALIDHIKTLDEEMLNNLINIVDPKLLSVEGKSQIISKPIHIINRMYSLLGLDNEVHKTEYFEKRCFQITAQKLKMKNLDVDEFDVKIIIQEIYLKFQADLRIKLSKMKKKKILKITDNIKNQLESDGKALTTSGATLAATLAAGEVAGFALFTSTAVGLKAVGLLFGATFSFGTYGAVMSTLGVVFGPAGFIVAGGVFAGGVIKVFLSKKRNKVVSAILTIIIDMKEKEEKIFIKKHFKYSQELLEESKRFLPLDLINYGNFNQQMEEIS